jgi:hypothetical protein
MATNRRRPLSNVGLLMPLAAWALLGLLGGCESSTNQSQGPSSSRASGGASGAGQGGRSGSGGSAGSNGAGSGSGGSSSGGSSGSDAGATLPPINESGMATAKFCNLIAAQDGDLMLTMELGTKKVKLVASTGECAPIKGQACAAIPAGNIPVTMSLDGEVVIRGVLTVIPDKPVVLLAEFDEATQQPKLRAGGIKPEFKCEEVELGGPAPDGGAPDTGGGSGPKPPPRL